jgi:hypothetical protein
MRPQGGVRREREHVDAVAALGATGEGLVYIDSERG